MRGRITAAPAALALLLAGCGGDTEGRQAARTVVQTVTVGATPPQTATTPAPAPAGDAARDDAPLPEGVTAADGKYEMKVRRTSFDQPGVNPALDDEYPSRTTWRFTTTCKEKRCTIRMDREVASGGFKTIVLSQNPDRPGVFVGKASAMTVCTSRDAKRVSARQCYSVKLSGSDDVSGRQIATRVEAYLSEATQGCKVKPARARVSWSGRLQR